MAAAAAPASIHAQPAQRVELTAQLTAVRLSGIEETDVGLSGTVGWLITDRLVLEAAAAFFPGDEVLRGGRKLHVLAGPKIGWRADRVGLFARPSAGIARVGEGRQVGVCILIFPPPEACFTGETRLAVDLAGVFELYPSSRSQLRFEIGDLVTRLSRSSYRFARSGDFAHDLRVAAGAGVRF